MTKAMNIQLLSFLLPASLKHTKLSKVITVTSIIEFVTYINVICTTVMPQEQGKESSKGVTVLGLIGVVSINLKQILMS